jgi:predicted unusual protein kinase regulating ubiquinone biosynthesis (AarF/ABC1/UbiB family)
MVKKEVAVPSGRLGRMARIGALAIGAAGGAVLRRSNEEAAERAAAVLGNLRGLAAKLGQMASYVDGLVPEDKRDAFEASLKMLRAQAPRSNAAEIRQLVESELGAPIDKLFASWDDQPIASASIGQVHHAVLPDEDGGFEVAVKVQHPGIRKAVESDLASASILEGIASMTGARRFDTKTQLEVIRTRFREELDYELEASRLVHFGKVHAGDPKIKIPKLITSCSAKSVLTTEFVRGASLEDVITLSPEERRAFAETLWRFVFKGNLVGGMFNADPHPGNYLFHLDTPGEITFLDYGCVQVIPEDRRPDARALHRAAIERDEETFAKCVSRLLNARPGELERRARAYTRLCFRPLFDQPSHITRSYAASLVDEMKTMALAARKIPQEEFFTLPPEMLFMNRLQFGFYSVLARLDVDVNYAAVEAAFLPKD